MNDDSYHSYSPSYRQYPKQSQSNTLISKELQAERKFFTLQLRENERGKFLRLTEEAQGRRNTVIIPASGFREFAALVDEILSSTEAES